MKNNGLRNADLRKVANSIEPHTDLEVDATTGMVVYKFRLPPELRTELLKRAKQEHITLRELLTRAASLYLSLDLTGRKPGSYVELHEPGETPQKFLFPFWPFRRKETEQ